MTHWRLTPDRIKAILTDVNTRSEELGEALTESRFQGILDGLTWGAPFTDEVPAAVNALLGDQATNLTNIGNRINAGTVGVANAVIAYNNGQEEMCGTYQAELLKSAESGDFSFFVQHGHQG